MTVLLWGEDEFLLRLAARELIARREVRATEVDGGDWRGGETTDLATPSLWGERRALLVTDCQRLPESGAGQLREYLQAPLPDALCVLTVVSRGKSPPPLAKATQAGGGQVRRVSLRRQDLPQWVLDRAMAKGLRLRGPGAAALIAIQGESPATLEQSVEQLAAAFADREVGPEEVRSQFQGLGEQRVWNLCDQALSGRASQAMVALRALLEAREDPLMILGGIASRVRDLIRVSGLPGGLSGAEAARAAGLRFDWQVRVYREQARRFPPGELTRLHDRLVELDRALKGGAPGDVVLPGLVAAMAGVSEAALDLPLRVGR